MSLRKQVQVTGHLIKRRGPLLKRKKWETWWKQVTSKTK